MNKIKIIKKNINILKNEIKAKKNFKIRIK